jgi:putative transposase
VKKPFSVEQITTVLQQVAQGVPVRDLCHKVGFSEQSFYRWKKTYGSRQPSDARDLKQLRDEVTKLKRSVADLSLDKVMLQDVIQNSSKTRKATRSSAVLDGTLRRECAARVSRHPGHPIVGVLQDATRSAHRLAAVDARVRPGAGALRLSTSVGAAATGRLRGGKERFYRVYTEEGLPLRRKRPWRHATAVHREQGRPATRRNDIWSMGFVADELTDGRRFRTLTILDLFTRQCLDIAVGRGLTGQDVVAALERLRFDRGLPQWIGAAMHR